MLADLWHLEDRVTITGSRYGHLGGADILVGLDEARRSGADLGSVLIAVSSGYAFGVGDVVATSQAA